MSRKGRNLYAYTSPFEQRYLLFVRMEKYPNGGDRIQLYDSEDGSPYATATTHTVESLEPGEVAVKNWSENEGILEFLVENQFVEKPHRFVKQGFVRIPICKLISYKEPGL